MKKILGVVYDTLERNRKDWTPKAHYPSSASFKFSDGRLIGPDLLNEYLKWTGVTASNPSNGASLLKMELGNAAHKGLEKILQKSGMEVMSEVAGKLQLKDLKSPISYRVDHLIEDENELAVLEVKSTMQQQMYSPWGIQAKGPWATHPDHLLQVICYLEMVPGVKLGKLLYIDRGSGGMLEYNVNRLPASGFYSVSNSDATNAVVIPEVTWPGIIKRWKDLELAVASGKAPDPEYRAWINEKTGEVMPKKTIKGKEFKTNWRVLYSGYKDYIWKNPDYFKFSYNENPPKGVELVES